MYKIQISDIKVQQICGHCLVIYDGSITTKLVETAIRLNNIFINFVYENDFNNPDPIWMLIYVHLINK